MKDLIKDIMDEDFTLVEWIVLGVVFPVGVVLVALLGSIGD